MSFVASRHLKYLTRNENLTRMRIMWQEEDRGGGGCGK